MGPRHEIHEPGRTPHADAAAPATSRVDVDPLRAIASAGGNRRFVAAVAGQSRPAPQDATAIEQSINEQVLRLRAEWAKAPDTASIAQMRNAIVAQLKRHPDQRTAHHGEHVQLAMDILSAWMEEYPPRTSDGPADGQVDRLPQPAPPAQAEAPQPTDLVYPPLGPADSALQARLGALRAQWAADRRQDRIPAFRAAVIDALSQYPGLAGEMHDQLYQLAIATMHGWYATHPPRMGDTGPSGTPDGRRSDQAPGVGTPSEREASSAGSRLAVADGLEWWGRHPQAPELERVWAEKPNAADVGRLEATIGALIDMDGEKRYLGAATVRREVIAAIVSAVLDRHPHAGPSGPRARRNADGAFPAKSLTVARDAAVLAAALPAARHPQTPDEIKVFLDATRILAGFKPVPAIGAPNKPALAQGFRDLAGFLGVLSKPLASINPEASGELGSLAIVTLPSLSEAVTKSADRQTIPLALAADAVTQSQKHSEAAVVQIVTIVIGLPNVPSSVKRVLDAQLAGQLQASTELIRAMRGLLALFGRPGREI